MHARRTCGCVRDRNSIEWTCFHCSPRSRKPTSRRIKVKSHLLAVVCVFCTLTGTAVADTVYVDWNGGGDYVTIQEGITAASRDDTVLVASGTYSGPLNRDISFGGKDVYLVSEAGASFTIIDCENAGRGFEFTRSETPDAVVEGFTVMNGLAPVNDEGQRWGGALFCANSAPVILRCSFVDCYGE